MAVRADDLAFRDLLEDALPVAVGKRLANVELLVGEVIELEDHRVGLTAVDARDGAEETQQVVRALDRQRLFTGSRLIEYRRRFAA